MKIAKWTLVILVMLVIFSIAAMACSAKQPAINRDVEYSGKGAPPEEIRYEFITYIPLQDPKDIGDLLQKVDRWIKDHWQEYNIISVEIINATKVNSISESDIIMPSGAAIFYLPKEK